MVSTWNKRESPRKEVTVINPSVAKPCRGCTIPLIGRPESGGRLSGNYMHTSPQTPVNDPLLHTHKDHGSVRGGGGRVGNLPQSKDFLSRGTHPLWTMMTLARWGPRAVLEPCWPTSRRVMTQLSPRLWTSVCTRTAEGMGVGVCTTYKLTSLHLPCEFETVHDGLRPDRKINLTLYSTRAIRERWKGERERYPRKPGLAHPMFNEKTSAIQQPRFHP